MKTGDGRKIAVLGMVLIICVVLFASSIGYIAAFSTVFGGNLYLSPENELKESCVWGVLKDCNYNNFILNDLLCAC